MLTLMEIGSLFNYDGMEIDRSS